MVSTVRVDATAVVPVMEGGADTEQVGSVPDKLDVTAQVSATAPVNALVGVMMTEEDPEAPGEAMLMGLAASVKLGTAVDVTRTVVVPVAVVLPDVPVMLRV